MSINSMRSRNLGLLQEIIQEWIDEYYRMRDNQVRCLFYNEWMIKQWLTWTIVVVVDCLQG